MPQFYSYQRLCVLLTQPICPSHGPLKQLHSRTRSSRIRTRYSLETYITRRTIFLYVLETFTFKNYSPTKQQHCFNTSFFLLLIIMWANDTFSTLMLPPLN